MSQHPFTHASQPAVCLQDLTFTYPEQAAPALQGVEWEIAAGEFVLICGTSGSGKSTLLRCLNGLVPHFSGGHFGGVARIFGQDTRLVGPQALSLEVGFVFQDPEAQQITTRVDDELAFGLEQRGIAASIMRKRVEEVLDLLGIAHLRRREMAKLSGGERQRVAVAAVLAVQPRLLVLDEPTSQLDPWGAEEVMTALTRLNEDLGLTVVIAEHRLERVLGHADTIRALATRGGRDLSGAPGEVVPYLDPALLPPVVQVGLARQWSPLPLTIKAGRKQLARDSALASLAISPVPPASAGGEPRVVLDRVVAGFGEAPVLEAVSLTVQPGEVLALMGRNGSGKTTLLRLIMGLHRPQAGRVLVDGRDVARLDPAEMAAIVGYVPQNPGAILFAETLAAELAFTLRHHPRSRQDPAALLARLGLATHAATDPRDLSGGERQRAALAAILVGDPAVLLLDEPTRGMDGVQKQRLGALVAELAAAGRSVMLATHDVELVASVATRVALLGGGRIVAVGTPRQVLAGSLTYATQVNKLFGGDMLTVADVLGGTGAPADPQ